MRVEGNLGVTPPILNADMHSVRVKMSEFDNSSSSVKSAGAAKKSEPGFISKMFNGIISIPVMILSGLWTAVKYTVYVATCFQYCKPELDPAKIKKALEEYQKSDDKDKAWTAFNKAHPKSVGVLVNLCIENVRRARMGEKNSGDPKKVSEWNKNNLKTTREDLQARFKAHDEDLITTAIDYLQQMIDAKSKK